LIYIDIMDKQEIIAWLNGGEQKKESEIGTFLLDKMKEEKLEESWQKYYFLEELKKIGKYPSNVLAVFKEVEKNIEDEEGVPYWKRHLAFIVDYLVYGFLLGIIITVINPIDVDSDNFVLFIAGLGYFSYFTLSIYRFNTTLGSYIFKIKIVFNNKSNLFWKIFLREVLFLTVFTGIGCIFYLIYGAYWDRATGAEVKRFIK
jgi:hypothetical protein